MTSATTAAADARAEFSRLLVAKGHAVDNVRAAVAALKQAFGAGMLERTPDIDEALADLDVALAQADDQRLGGKSAEAARLIGRRIERLLAAQ
jgi:hypothetical protein